MVIAMMPMTRRTVFAAWVLGWLMITAAGAHTSDGSSAVALPSDADIRKVLGERVDALAGKEDGIGIVVGVVGPHGRRVISYGHLDRGDPRPLAGDTVFEIGSVGKVFTALLLADMVRRGEVALADPVAKYLPAGVKIPERNGHAITLLNLATHTSGLPFMPDEVPVYNDPAAKYSDEQLYRFLARYRLTSDPGADWDYSNIGYWLLGQALASRGGMAYEDLLRTRIIVPLKLKSTAIASASVPLPPRLGARLAVGHNAILQPAPLVTTVSIYAAMPAAGVGQVSTVNDLLTVLAVAMGYEPSPLASSMALMLSQQRPLGGDGQALGWVVLGKGDDQLVMHDGATWGSNSYVAWDPRSRVGVVALSNQLATVGDIARHLLRPNVPLERPTVTKHTEIALDSALLDAYAGQYEVEDEGAFTIVRERAFLTLQAPIGWGLPRFRLRPESRTDFFVAELPFRVTFQEDDAGRVTGALIYPPRGQRGIPAKRISSVK